MECSVQAGRPYPAVWPSPRGFARFRVLADPICNPSSPQFTTLAFCFFCKLTFDKLMNQTGNK
jgi:hypothetical protein